MKNRKLSIIQEAVLAQIPKGIQSPILCTEIMKRVGLSNREVRAVISTLVVDHNIPVGGCRMHGRSGYFIITNEEERSQATTPLKNSVVSLQQRIDRLEKIKI